uniref:Nucleolar pre-ribosomal-associated protein 1 n=1 Tax=Cajanus cajan TaxID=3821 RepID=A0A151SBR0_CAJCA|nr:Nucleolar pre-ribosomal-associated protein 1 [Cajanus cajan]
MAEGSAAVPNFQAKVSHEAKLKELLHRLTSPEIKLCSDAAKEFARLLKSETGGDLLRDHSEGKEVASDAESVSVAKYLDEFAQLLIAKHLHDIYKEVESRESRRQKAALSLSASIVRRGARLASELAKVFEFDRIARPAAKIALPRKWLVGFAMSFLEVGKPWLLRFVLNKKEMYSRVLRELAEDDDETVVFALSVLRDRVLVGESLVSPALRSVLFQSAALEQLVEVCGREGGGEAADVAFGVLVRVCTHPSNGLMPDLKMRLKGNPRRILGLMKKLRVTEVQYHSDLLFAIVDAKASFGLSYLKEFPYNIENYKSSSWISAISVAAQLVSSVGKGLSKEFVNFRSNNSRLFDNMDLQSVVKCLFPRPFSRSLFNRGLPHIEPYVKHGTLRLLLELLKLLDSLFGGLNDNSSSNNSFMQHVVSVKGEIQNYVQAFLPDLQVLLNLLSSLDASFEARNSSLKRNACQHDYNSSSRKKLKKDTSESDINIVVVGISSIPDINSELRADDLDDEEDFINSIGKIWGVDLRSMDISTLKDMESYLLSKLLDAIRYYRRALPLTLDNSFETFKGLLKNPLELTSHLQVSLLSLLVEYIDWCPDDEIPMRTPPMLYKYLQPFIKLLMFSPYNETRDLAYRLAWAAMFSTGAFDSNLHEIEAWFLFLPGYHRKKSPVKILEVDVLQSLTLFVISFLCDAVSTLGNNLVKYWNILMSYVHCLEGCKDSSPHFSPFIICVLEKCLKVIRPKSGSCSLPKKSMVLLYTCNTVKYRLQTQVNAELLSALVHADLTERFGGSYECDEVFSEWKPLKDLLDFVESTSYQRNTPIQLCYEFRPIAEIEQLLNLCIILVGNLLGRLLVSENDSHGSKNSAFCSSRHNSQEVIKTIFCHPCVLMSLSSSLGNCQNNLNGYVKNDFNMLNLLSSEGFHKFGNPILKLLTMTLDYTWSLFGTHICSKAEDVADNFVKAFQDLQQKLFLDVRVRFELCICSKDFMPLLPTLYALHTLHRFVSPFQLLELVDWMFSSVDVDDLPIRKSSLFVGCSLAADAFSALSIYFQQSTGNRAPYDLFWEMGEKHMKADIFEQIYSKVVEFSVSFEMDSADRCLLEAVNSLYKQKHMQQETFHPLLLVMWKIIMITPLKMISHCIFKTNVKKAKFLHILTELSSLHSTIFGHLFLGTVNRSLHNDIGVVGHPFDITPSEDQFVLLLPAALSYLSLISKRLGELSRKDFKHIPCFYSIILLKGFSQWKSFSSKDIFEEQYGEFFPSSVQELLCLIDCSLLGKSIHMLKYHFALNGGSMKLKKRLNLFKSICPKFATHDDLMDCDSQVIDSYSMCQSLNIINRVVAKISLCRILLFYDEAGGNLKDISGKIQIKLGTSRIRFINILVDIWQLIVKKFSLASDQSRSAKGTNISLLYNHLEGFLLKGIHELAVEMHDDLIQLKSISFLEQLIRSALLYRFGDFATMKTLRVILSQLSEGRILCDLYLQLLLSHSQFAPTLHSVRKLAGSFLKPVSSILKCVVIPSLDQCENEEKHVEQTTEISRGPLEIVKLLWALLCIKARQTDSDHGNDIDINLKELHALLCHSYGATLNWIDLAICNLMQQIESMGGLWSQNVKLGSETIEEWYISQHRDNIPIDPDICVSTVLYFPYDRCISDEVPYANKIEHEPDTVGKKVHSSHVEDREQYDPVFILRFSIHSLSKAYIDPVEFAGSGLLAIAFVSMSSPDHGIRILASDTLYKFKNVLEFFMAISDLLFSICSKFELVIYLFKCQEKKDEMGLQLLLNSVVQNSIKDPWQRIPSVISLFAAEASCVLLDPSHDHYAAITDFLMNSSMLDMRVIPMFDNFFGSTSVNFKAKRSWILRLVYAGLNSDDDATIYIKNSVLEKLMNFYVNSLSDFESKNLIIEVIKKSVKLREIARHLVNECSLFSWFSCLISVTRQRLNGDESKHFLKHVFVALKSMPVDCHVPLLSSLSSVNTPYLWAHIAFTQKLIPLVVNDVISSGSISKWLQNHGLEQLMELSSNLFNFILHDVTLANGTAVLINPFLRMMASMLKLSQKRKVDQPHFTLSIEGLYQMYQAGSVCNQTIKSIKPELALEAILMNAPPVSIFLMNQERLQSFLIWATTTALQSESSQRLGFNESQFFRNNLREDFRKNSVVSAYLRWLTASVIIGKLHKTSDNMDTGFTETHNFESLHSLLVQVENTSGQRHDIDIGAEELLASTIFYLQLLLGINPEMLPSVVCALCLLIFGDSNFAVGRIDLLRDYDSLISSHSSRVRCPPEANPTWRWSFYHPWKDHTPELTDSQKMEEYHSCQTLLVIISNVLSGNKLESACLSPVDLERSGLFQWERSLLRN